MPMQQMFSENISGKGEKAYSCKVSFLTLFRKVRSYFLQCRFFSTYNLGSLGEANFNPWAVISRNLVEIN